MMWLLGIALIVIIRRIRIFQMRSDALFQHDRKQPIHCIPAAGDLLHNLNTITFFTLKGLT
jgi:hypothetical protein